jgi:DNA replication protein DnaC
MDKELAFYEQSDLLVLPDRFLKARVDEKTNPAIKELLREYIGHLEEYKAAGVAPSFFGTAGSGKTYAAAVVAKLLIAKGARVYWASTVSELNKLLDYRDYRFESYFALKNKLLTTDVVIFDDFGQLRDYQRVRETFFEIVDYRYSWKLSTIFTANFNLDVEENWTIVGKGFGGMLARRVQSMSEGLVFNAS